MPSDKSKVQGAIAASREALYGAFVGAAKWGAAFAALGGIGYLCSPLYRSLTIQFKTYIQMSGMILGGWVEADYQVRAFEARMRREKRLEKDQWIWRRYEEEYVRQMEEEKQVRERDGKDGDN